MSQQTSTTIFKTIKILKWPGDLHPEKSEPVLPSTQLNLHHESVNMLMPLHQNQFCSVSDDNSIKVWSLKENKWVLDQSIRKLARSVNHLIQLNSSQLCAASGLNKLQLWQLNDAHTWRPFQTLIDDSAVLSVSLLTNGQLCSYAWDNRVSFWDKTDSNLWKKTTSFKAHSELINSLIELKDGTLCTTSDDTTVKCWAPSQSAPLLTMTHHQAPVNQVIELNQTGLCSIDDDGLAVISDRKSGDMLATLMHGNEKVKAVIQLNDTMICTRTDQHALYLWESSTPTKWGCKQAFQAHDNTISSFGVLKNGLLFSSSQDKTAKVWDINTGKCLHHLGGLQCGIMDAIELHTGQLCVATWDGSVAIYDL